MDTSKIELNKQYNTMKELCTLVGLDTKGGKQQKLSVATLERYLSYTKVGRKVTVTEIYEFPMPKPISKDNLWINPPIIALLRYFTSNVAIDRNTNDVYHVYINNYELA
jgi:hypothetical protein